MITLLPFVVLGEGGLLECLRAKTVLSHVFLALLAHACPTRAIVKLPLSRTAATVVRHKARISPHPINAVTWSG